MKVALNKDHWKEQQYRERQERDAQRCITDASRIPEALRDAPVRAGFVRLDRDLEDRLRQQGQHASAEEGQRDPCETGDGPEIDACPDEVDDDAEIRELEGQPHVRATREDLKPATEALDQVQEGQIDVDHLRTQAELKLGPTY